RRDERAPIVHRNRYGPHVGIAVQRSGKGDAVAVRRHGVEPVLAAVGHAALRAWQVRELAHLGIPAVSAEEHRLLEIVGETARDGEAIGMHGVVGPLAPEAEIAPGSDRRAAALA